MEGAGHGRNGALPHEVLGPRAGGLDLLGSSAHSDASEGREGKDVELRAEGFELDVEP